MKKLLASGFCGFIGSYMADFMLKKYPDLEILNLDNLSYAALPHSNDFAESTGRYKHEYINIVNASEVIDAFQRFKPDYVIHAAAESNVDFSLNHIKRHRFIETNVLGTNNMMDAARQCDTNPRIVYINTDEIYGEILNGSSDEHHPLNPRNAYAASKTAGGMIANSYYHSFGLRIMQTMATNTYGPRQDSSKFIPKSIFRVLVNKPILLNDKGQHVRSWLNVENHCAAVDAVLMNGKPGLNYNINGGEELSNLQMAKLILRTLDASMDFYEFANLRHCDDLRYSVDSIRVHETGYKPNDKYNLQNSFKDTVHWYVDYAKKYPNILQEV
jgi:dTDP-glucose 4,6-dehydratase